MLLYYQFLFLNTLAPVAGTAAFEAVGAFLVPPAPIPLKVPITVLFAGAAFAATGFLTIVELLPSLESLIVLARPLPVFLVADGAGAAAFLPRPTPVVAAGLGSVAFRTPVPRVALAFSTMLVSMPAAPPDGTGAEGLSGDIDRVRVDFGGSAGRIGDRGSVREFADLGDNICDGATLPREAIRSGGTGSPRGFFFGFSRSSFSLSIDISSLDV